LIPVGFGYGDGDEFFLRGWVWDSKTRARPAPLPSLPGGSTVSPGATSLLLDARRHHFSSLRSFRKTAFLGSLTVRYR